MFDWYQLIWYHEPKAQFPYEKKVMGQWISTADTCTDLMAYSIITRTRKVITRKAVWGVTKEELSTNAIWEQLNSLDESIKERIENQIKNDKAAHEPGFDHEDTPEGLFDDEEEPIAEPIEPELSAPEADEYTLEAYNKYLMAEVVLPQNHMAVSLRDASFVSGKADPDVWMKAAAKPNGDKSWA